MMTQRGRVQGLVRGISLWLGVLVASLLVAACLPQGVRVPQSPLLRVLERKSGRIVYVGTDGNIYTIDQGGGNLRAITDDAQLSSETDAALHFYQFPAWSPDSKRIAFVSVSGTTEAPVQASVFTAAPDGTDRVEVFSSKKELPLYLYWSPDGERLGFLTTIPFRTAAVLWVTSAREDTSQVLDTGQPYYWAWAPDGRQMLIHAGGDGPAFTAERLALLHLGDEVIEEGLALPPARFRAPAWSRDGQRLLLAIKTRRGREALVLADRQGNVEKVLTTFDGSIAFAWSPDGEKVAYITGVESEPSPLGPLNVIDLKKPTEIKKTEEEEEAIAFFWSPDSKKIAYFVPSMASRASQSEQSGQSGQSQQDEVVVLSLRIFDVDSGNTWTVATFRPTNQFLALLPNFDQYQRSATIWSPDSRNLVLPAYATDGEPGIWVAAASGKLALRYLADGVLAFWSWQ